MNTASATHSSSAVTGQLSRARVLKELEALETQLHQWVAPERIERSLPEKVHPLLRPARYKGLFGGRGGVKSHSFARLLVAHCLRHPGVRWLCAREIQNSLKDSVKQLLEDIIVLFGVGDRFTIYDTRIVTPGGGVIIFQGLQNHTTESIKSLENFNGAWVEEASSLSEKSLKVLRPTIRAKSYPGSPHDSELWFSWNPDQAKDPVDKLLRGSVPPQDAIVLETNWKDNPYFPDVLRREMETDYSRDPDSAAHVWGGQYAVRSKASVFRNWRVASFATPSDAAFLFGGDWGFSVDPTVLVRGFVADGDLRNELIVRLGLSGRPVLCLDAAVYQVGCEIDDTPALFDKIDMSAVGMPRGWAIVADSARPETISYMQRHGYPRITPARKGAGSVEEGVTFLQSYDLVVHPQCCYQCGDGTNHVVDELENYRYKVHPLTNDVMPVLEDKKNHTIDAVRYMVEPLNKEKEWHVW